MLDKVTIKNFALIEELEIDLKNGFNVIVGETGSGKSIFLNALSFVLGNKADRNLIRQGKDFTRVTLTIYNPNKNVKHTLQEYNIDIDDEELIISRTYNLDNKNDCRVNGCPVTVSLLKNISSVIVDCYYQHEGTELLKVKNHIKMLDNYRPKFIEEEKNKLKEYVAEYKRLKLEMDDLGFDEEKRIRDIELFEYQINEIEEANIQENEENEIRQQIKIIRNAEKIATHLSNVRNLLYENSMSVLSNLNQITNEISCVFNYDNVYEKLNERIDNCKYELQDVYDLIENKMNELSFDENELIKLDARLDVIKNIKKKYGQDLESINKYLTNIKEECYKLQNSKELLDRLQKQFDVIHNQIIYECQKLSRKRKSLAEEIEERINTELKSLDIKSANFKVVFKENDQENFTENGIDDIEFFFSANTGEDIKSLNKIISGGEMSRFVMALKNILADNNEVETLIFDEIDAGISGETGKKVAEKLAVLSRKYQVLCISHMPQVIAMADNYYYVNKIVVDNKTYSTVKILNNDEIISCISKVSSGDILTNASINHARELKQLATNYKSQIK